MLHDQKVKTKIWISSEVKWKAFFIIFKGLSIVKNCLRPESAPLNTIAILILNVSIDSYISHDEFVSINNVLTEYNEMKKEIKNRGTSVEYII